LLNTLCNALSDTRYNSLLRVCHNAPLTSLLQNRLKARQNSLDSSLLKDCYNCTYQWCLQGY